MRGVVRMEGAIARPWRSARRHDAAATIRADRSWTCGRSPSWVQPKFLAGPRVPGGGCPYFQRYLDFTTSAAPNGRKRGRSVMPRDPALVSPTVDRLAVVESC